LLIIYYVIFKICNHLKSYIYAKIYYNVNVESKNWLKLENGFKYILNEDLSFSKKRKLNISNMQISGIVNFNKFVNEMNNIEIKSK